MFAKRTARVRFLVDTGATSTILPRAVADRIGAPELAQRFDVSLADGRRKRLPACAVGILVSGRRGPTTVLVIPRGEPLLGVETLESLGLKVNPEKGRLEPSRRAAALLVGVRAMPKRHR